MLQSPQLDSACRGFSTPADGPFRELAALVTTTYAEVLLEQFLRLYAKQLATNAPELGRLLAARAGRLEHELVWDPCLGELWRAVREPAEDAWHVATALGLRLVARDRQAGEWSGPLPANTRVLFDRWLLPNGERILARCNGRKVELELALNGTLTTVVARFEDNAWQADGECVTALPRPTLLIVPPEAVSPRAREGLRGEIASVIEPEMSAACAAALDLLGEHSAPYAAWVRYVVRQIMPLVFEPGRSRSGSRSDHPGLVHMSLPDDAIVLADNLVHEASHQYYHLACHIDRIDTGEDQRLYYSPAVGQERPLSRILLAFHAFGNVALLYQACLATGIRDGGYCSRRCEELAPRLRQLYEPLDGNSALTPVGAALVYPLAERLAAQGVL